MTDRQRHLFAILVGAIIAVSLVGLFRLGQANPHVAPSPSASPSPSVPVAPSPSQVTYSEAAACTMYVPVATDGVKQMTALYKGRAVDWTEVEAAFAAIDMVTKGAPPSMLGDLTIIRNDLALMLGIHNGTATTAQLAADRDFFFDAGIRLVTLCSQYVN